LAYALELLGRGGEAQSVIRSGLAAFPDQAGLREMLKPAVAPVPFSEDPPLPESVPALARLRAMPASDEHLFWLHKIYTDRASHFFTRLQQVAPDSARVAQAKGLNAEYAEDYAAAEAFYRQALQKAPQTAGLHFALGHVMRLQGKDDEAEAELAQEGRH